MDADWWSGIDAGLLIGIVLSLPIGVIASLIAPRIRDWLDGRAERLQKRRRLMARKEREQEAALLLAELERLKALKTDQPLYWEFLLGTIIRAGLYGAITGLFGGMLGSLVFFLQLGGFTRNIALGSMQIVALIGSLMIFQVSWRAIQTIKRLSNLDDFSRHVHVRVQALHSSSDGL